MFDPISAGISAAASIFGGLLNKSSNDKTNSANLAFQREQLARQEALQREFAQSGIQWKVQDAQKAGIHPLYALGANTVSYAPSTVGNPLVADTSLGSGVASAGQDISRALTATRTGEQRADAFTKTAQALTIQKMGLENDLLASQVAKMRGQVGPPLPALTDSDFVGTGRSPIPRPDPRGPAMVALDAGPFGKSYVRVRPGEATQDDLEKHLGEPADVYGWAKLIRAFDQNITGYHDSVRPRSVTPRRNPFSRSYERR